MMRSTKRDAYRHLLRLDMDAWFYVHIVEKAYPECVDTQTGLTYWRVKLGSKRYYLHRIIFELNHGMEVGTLPSTVEIHHKNGNTFDNRLDNLQALSKSEHARVTLHARNNGGYAHASRS